MNAASKSVFQGSTAYSIYYSFRRIERLQFGFGHNHRHGFADVARLIDGQQQVGAEQNFSAPWGG